MTYAADLHIHSGFARGTSKDLTFDNLAHWARLKGIDLLASADFTHPAWLEETGRRLSETGDGLYEHDGVKFVLGTEVNCNAEQGGRNRRVHMLVFAPSLSVVRRINLALSAKGKLEGDGRPTLHMTPRDLVRTLLDVDERCLFIPAHAWTPWFGVFGSKSGFDSLEECFGDEAEHILAIETGLSSEPAMNWRVPELDTRSIVSFSDAHSLPKLGRELTVFEGEPSFDGLSAALRTQAISYTAEFFPEEGKYHFSGHRKCGVRYSPAEAHGDDPRCPECRRKLTLGVMHRLEELAGREVATWAGPDGLTRADNGRPPFRMLVALEQILAESLGIGVQTKGVRRAYLALVSELGPELSVLTEASLPDIALVGGARVAEGVGRVRLGDISIEPGYDGEYGRVSVWPGGGITRP